jgi:hypothetical protein
MVKSPSESRRNGRLARMVVFAAATAMSMAAIGQARADVTDQLLDQLRAKGVLTHGEYAKLRARHAAEKADMDRPRHYSKDGVIVVPDDRYISRLDKGIGFHIPGLVTKEGEVGAIDVKISGDLVFGGVESFQKYGNAANPTGGVITDSSTMAHNSIQAGLLPSAIVLSLATNQVGYDLGFTIGAYTGGNNVTGVGGANSAGNPVALGTPGIDLRQVFGTVGTPTFGTVKIGRDLGLFGSDAILNDATLLGLGSPLSTAAPSNTSFGRIGIGYIYADWIPQVTYTTPDFNGFTASLGAFTPLNASTLTGFAVPGGAGVLSDNTFTGQEAPMVQGQVKWKGNIAPGAALTLSADGLWQEHRAEAGDDVATFGDPTITNVTVNVVNPFFPGVDSAVESWGADGFGKLDIDGFSFVAYGYYGNGLGTTGLFSGGFDAAGNARTSYGGYVQGSYTWDKFTFGASWGVSALNATGFDWSSGVAPGLVKDNESVIGFVRYQLTPWVALQGEFGHTWAINQAGGEAEIDDIWLGTAWFF